MSAVFIHPPAPSTDLRNDGNARRVTLKMDKSYKTVVGDSGAQLGASWLRSLADAMHISEARFKKPTLQMGEAGEEQ